jgi:hypothetical protein
MDEPATAESMTWSPRWAMVAAVGALGAVIAVIAFTTATSDGVGGTLLVGLAGAVLSVAAYDAIVRPTLVATPDGLTIRQGWQPRHYPWPAITRIEVVTTRRLLVLHALEIDAGDDLVLLTQRRLGAELSTVAATLATYRATRVE